MSENETQAVAVQQHDYQNTGAVSIFPDGQREIGQQCSHCSLYRTLVHPPPAEDGEPVEPTESFVDDTGYTDGDPYHGFNLPSPECPPTGEWMVAFQSLTHMVDMWDGVTEARRFLQVRMDVYKQSFRDTEELMETFDGPRPVVESPDVDGVDDDITQED